MLKAVLFDMDGVLVDSEVLHGKAAVMTLEQLGVSVTLEYCFGFIGSTTAKMMDTIIREFNLPYTVTQLLTLYKEVKHKLLETDGYDKIPFTKELIIHLNERGIKLAIASSSTLDEIHYVTSRFGIDSYFDKIISGATLKNPKPAPDIYEKAAKELGVLVSECIVIEDSMFGVMAAVAARMPVVGFINKNSGNQDLSKANILIEGFEEIDFNFLNQVYNRHHNIPITIYEDDSIIIRELTTNDVKFLYNIYKEETICKYITPLSKTLDEELLKHEAYIKNIYHFYGYGLWGVFLPTGELIGRCGIENKLIDNKVEYELGYLIKKEYQNRGYATRACNLVIDYAFNLLDLNRIICVIDKNNIPSIQVAKKLGMNYEKDIMFNDKECVLYAINQDRKEISWNNQEIQSKSN